MSQYSIELRLFFGFSIDENVKKRVEINNRFSYLKHEGIIKK